MNSNSSAKDLLKKLSAQRRADKKTFVSPARAAYASAKQAASATISGRQAATELLSDRNISSAPAGWGKMSADDRSEWVYKNVDAAGILNCSEIDNVIIAISRLSEIS